MDEITIENLGKVNIKKLALNRERLGTLVFERSAPFLEKLQSLIIEFDKLDYPDNLSLPEIQQIDNLKSYLVDRLKELINFDIQQPNAKDFHDQFEVSMENYFNSVFQQLRPSLTFLRQEATQRSSSQKVLRESRQEAIQAKKEFEELKEQYEKQIKTLLSEQRKVEQGSGQLATKTLAKYFDHEVNDNAKEAKKWEIFRWVFFGLLTGFISLNIIGYLLIFIFGNKLAVWLLTTSELFTLEYAVIKLTLFIILSYGLVFSSRQYSINLNLAATNRHRRNVANTIDDYLGTNPPPEIKSQIIKQGAEAMFKHFPTGYIGKVEAKDNAPIHEVITAFKPI